MLDDTAVQARHARPLLDAGVHHVNAAARRVHLLAGQDVARTRRQAEAAVDALVDERLERRERREITRTKIAGTTITGTTITGITITGITITATTIAGSVRLQADLIA